MTSCASSICKLKLVVHANDIMFAKKLEGNRIHTWAPTT